MRSLFIETLLSATSARAAPTGRRTRFAIGSAKKTVPTHDDPTYRLAGFGVLRQRWIVHPLFDLKMPRLLTGLLGYCLVDVRDHRSALLLPPMTVYEKDTRGARNPP